MSMKGFPDLCRVGRERSFLRRCNRITVGFWLGGVLLGTAGCLLGASLSSHHPVARILSVLWWGISCGCLGASLGALPGLFLDRTPARLSSRSDGVGKSLTEADSDSPTRPTELIADPAVMVVSSRGVTRG